MLQGRTLGEAMRVRDIVVALEQQEITLNEFSEAVGTLTPEAIQVTASLLLNWNDLDAEEQERVLAARIVCRRLASAARILS